MGQRAKLNLSDDDTVASKQPPTFEEEPATTAERARRRKARVSGIDSHRLTKVLAVLGTVG